MTCGFLSGMFNIHIRERRAMQVGKTGNGTQEPSVGRPMHGRLSVCSDGGIRFSPINKIVIVV